MAIPKRHGSPPGTYFVTSRTWGSRRIFKAEPTCRIFSETLIQYRERKAYLLHAFVLMPDHFHVPITPAIDKTLERVVQYIKGASAHRIESELKFTFPVWQRGFSDHRMRDAEDYEAYLRYIELNPVKRRIVASASEYGWSSASGRFLVDEPPQALKRQEGIRRLSNGTAEAVP